MCIALLASASAFVAPPAPLRPRGMTAESPLALRRDRPLHVGPQMVLGETGPLPLLAVELFGSEYPDPLVAVGAVAALAAFAWSLRTSFAGGAAIILLLLGGDPEERVASGTNENEILKQIATLITPSAWKKSYLGDNAVEGEEPQLLDLPAWQGQEARELVEPEAVVKSRGRSLVHQLQQLRKVARGLGLPERRHAEQRGPRLDPVLEALPCEPQPTLEVGVHVEAVGPQLDRRVERHPARVVYFPDPWFILPPV